jgi:hypothetical protein
MSSNQPKLPNSKYGEDNREKSTPSAEITQKPSAGDKTGQLSENNDSDLDCMQKPNEEVLKRTGYIEQSGTERADFSLKVIADRTTDTTSDTK